MVCLAGSELWHCSKGKRALFPFVAEIEMLFIELELLAP